MRLLNFTAMVAHGVLAFDKQRHQRLVIVVKGTFDILPDGEVQLATEQAPLVFTDELLGSPGKSSPRYENDFAVLKPRCDVIVLGAAHAPGEQPAEAVDVTLQLGSIEKTARVFGDRSWQAGLLGWAPDRPKPFRVMPLTWERAFGGADRSSEDPREHAYELRNPVGVGVRGSKRALAGSPLPNVEDPRALIRGWKDRPAPMGFGFVGRGWQPRLKYGGTYDERWMADRAPFLPEDFDERFHQGAPEDQQCPYPRGGERVLLVNFTPSGRLAFRLPALRVPVVVEMAHAAEEPPAHLDTVLIEPDARRLMLTWRASVRYTDKPGDPLLIAVGEPSAAFRRARETGKVYVDWRGFGPPVGPLEG